MKTYQLLEPGKGFEKIITYAQGEEEHVLFITSEQVDLKVPNHKLFGFLLEQVIHRKIDPRLANDIMENYSYLFRHYNANKLDLMPLFEYFLYSGVLSEALFDLFDNLYLAMKTDSEDIQIPFFLVKDLINIEQFDIAFFLYSTLCHSSRPQTMELDNLIKEITQGFSKIKATFSTIYAVSQYQKKQFRVPEIQPFLYEDENEQLELALALSRETNDTAAPFTCRSTVPQNLTLEECQQMQRIEDIETLRIDPQEDAFREALALSLNRTSGYGLFHTPPAFPCNRKGFESIANKDIVKILNLSDNYRIGTAVDDGGCFFDSLGQILNQMQDTNIYTEQYLRDCCFEFFVNNPDFVNALHCQDYDKNANPQPYKMIIHRANSRKDNIIWGRSQVEGIILCCALTENLLPAIHIVEFIIDPDNFKYIPAYQRVTKNGIEPVNSENFYQENIPVLMVTQEDLHFIPALPVVPEVDDELALALAMSMNQ